MGLPWIKVSVDLPDHPKLNVLEGLLGMSESCGVAVMIRLWCWAARIYPDGRIPQISWSLMANKALSALRTSARSRRGVLDPDKVCTALVQSGLADLEGSDVLVLHDWDTFNGPHAEQQAKNRERQRKFKLAHPGYYSPSGNGKSNSESVTDNGPVTLLEERREEENREDPPVSPAGGRSGSSLRFSKRPRKGDTLAQEVLRAEQDVVTDRARVLWKALEQQPMDEAEMLAFAQARWKSGPANERVVGEALKALQAQGGPRPVKPVEVWQRPEWVPFLAAQEQSIEGLSSAEVAKAFEAFVASHTQGPEVRE